MFVLPILHYISDENKLAYHTIKAGCFTYLSMARGDWVSTSLVSEMASFGLSSFVCKYTSKSFRIIRGNFTRVAYLKDLWLRFSRQAVWLCHFQNGSFSHRRSSTHSIVFIFGILLDFHFCLFRLISIMNHLQARKKSVIRTKSFLPIFDLPDCCHTLKMETLMKMMMINGM